VGEVLIKAPMPGVIAHVFVEEGQAVTKGEVVVILESMKMQNEFKSPKDGTIKSVRIQAGDKIDQQAIMVTIS
jgi:biotin carboxyl carrier protein